MICEMKTVGTGPELPQESYVRERVTLVYKKSLVQLDEALLLGVKLVEASAEINAIPGLPPKTVFIVMGLYSKALKTVRAVRLGVAAGLLEDGNSLCRSLLETCVAIQYLLQQDWATRADEYAAYPILKSLGVAKKWQGTPGLEEDGKCLEIDVNREIARQLGNITPDRQKTLRRSSYSGMSLEDTFTAVGMGVAYQTVYRHMSPHAHASQVDTHFDFQAARGLALHPGTCGGPELRKLIDTTRWFFAGIMEIVSKTMGFGYLAAIDRFMPGVDDPTNEVVRAWHARVEEREQKARILTPPQSPAPGIP